MRATSIRIFEPRGATHGFLTGVSLHSHTLHSRESLDFIYHASRHSALLRHVLKRGEDRYRRIHGTELNLRRGWWTPPLAPSDAFALESAQIEGLDLQSFVSLTDHDDIEAAMSLQAVHPGAHVPVSVEWTVPYRETYFHIGVHNLAPARARMLMAHLAAYTANPDPEVLTELLEELAADPATLIVFNHPLWDEKGVGRDVHDAALLDLLTTRSEFFHAVEINGLRPWSENARVVELGRTCGKPVVSGGDRHALEPNACVNLTNAASFREFAAEVRAGHSHVLFLPQYQMAHASRIFHNMLDVFRTYENHGRGWKDWGDRVFYARDCGRVESLAQIWGERPPQAVAIFAGFMRFAGQQPVRRALRSIAGQAPIRVES